MKRNTSTIAATLMIALSACGFGAIAVFTLIATGAGATLQAVLIGRYAIAAIALFIIAGGARSFTLPRNKLLPLLVAGGIGQVLLTYFGLSALRYMPAATVAFLFYTYPVWVTLIAAILRTESLTHGRVLALGLALTGVAVMIGSPASGKLSVAGVLLSLAAALVYAVYIPLIGKLQEGVAPAVSAMLVSVSAGVIYAVVGAATGTIRLPHDMLPGWSAIVAIALLSTVAAFLLFLRGLAVLGSVRTAIVSTVEPFFTALLAALLLGQALALHTIAGGVLIASAVTLLSLSQNPESLLEK